MPLTVMAAEVADRLRGAELTYREAGRTAGVLPPGYHHLRRSAPIGSGQQTFAGAAAALLSWQVHLRAGMQVSASSAIAEPGTVVLLGLGTGHLRIGAPCRVVYLTDEPGRLAKGAVPQSQKRRPPQGAVRTSSPSWIRRLTRSRRDVSSRSAGSSAALKLDTSSRNCSVRSVCLGSRTRFP